MTPDTTITMKQRNHGIFSRVTRAPRWLLTMSLAIVLCHGTAVSASTFFGETLRSSEPASGTAYGYSLSISGETAAVSEWFDTGAIDILRLDPDSGSWQQEGRIETPAEQVDRVNFGFSTWLDGDHLVVGAPNILLTRPGAVSGYAYIYKREGDSGNWSLVTSIAGNEAGPDDFPEGSLGREVVIEQGRALISQRNADRTSTLLVYEENPLTGEWIETNTIAIGGSEDSNSSADIDQHSISALALQGDLLVVGVSQRDINDVRSAVVRVFELDQAQGEWFETERFDQFNIPQGGNTFLGVALDNDRLLINGEAGGFLYQRDSQSGLWSRDENFTDDVGNNLSNERLASDIEGTRVLVAGRDGTGILVYERDGVTNRWVETAELSIALLGETSPTVSSLDLQGDHVLVGIPYIEDFTGAVLAFRLDDPDADGIAAVDDNCPQDFNPTQSNFDEDLLGDACDLDDDNDNVADDEDAFPLDPDRQDAPASTGPDSSMAPGAPFPAWPFGSGIGLETDFRWPAVANAMFYVIEVQHDESIRAYEPMIAATTACSPNQCAYVKTDAVLNGANRWRLRAGNASGISDWSVWVDFFVGQPADSTNGSGNDSAAFTRLPAVPVPQRPVDDGHIEGVDYVWAAVPGVLRYAIEVQHEGSIRAYEPSLPVSEACTSGVCRYVKTDAARIGQNRWRLRAINNVGSSAWSEWANFSVETALPDSNAAFVPPVPFPASPMGDNDSRVAEFRWAEVTGATLYAVEIQHNETIRGYAGDIMATDACSSTGCVYSKEDAAQIGENRWRVRSGTENGFSEWSEWQVFTVSN